MPRPRRAAKARTDIMSTWQKMSLMLWPRCLGPEDVFEDEAHAREVYARHREDVLERYVSGFHAGRRPGAFWSFEPDVPAELRERPEVDPRPVLGGASHGDLFDAQEALDEARLRWLITQRQLSAAEVTALLAEAVRWGEVAERLDNGTPDFHGNLADARRRVAHGALVRQVYGVR